MTTPTPIPRPWFAPPTDLPPAPDNLALRPIIEGGATLTEQQVFVDHIRSVRRAAAAACMRRLIMAAVLAVLALIAAATFFSTAGEVVS